MKRERDLAVIANSPKNIAACLAEVNYDNDINTSPISQL